MMPCDCKVGGRRYQTMRSGGAPMHWWCCTCNPLATRGAPRATGIAVRCEPSHRSASPLALQCGHLGQLYITCTADVEHGVSAGCRVRTAGVRSACRTNLATSRSLHHAPSAGLRALRSASAEPRWSLTCRLMCCCLQRRWCGGYARERQPCWPFACGTCTARHPSMSTTLGERHTRT